MANKPQTRAWYSGRVPPDADFVKGVETLDQDAQVLYKQEDSESSGEYADFVKGVYNKMDSLKRNAAEFRTWTAEDGISTFYEVLLDVGPQDIKERVRFLQQIGAFRFRKGASAQDKKGLIEAIFAETYSADDDQSQSYSQAAKLGQVWGPHPKTLLDYTINQPAHMGRILADRLNPAKGAPLKVVGHPFEEVRSAQLQPLAESKVLAYVHGNEIHLFTSVVPILESWDQDANLGGGCQQVTLLETLFLHELVELVIAETSPETDPYAAHLVAGTFERYLKNNLLHLAVEDFYLGWPRPSAAEEEELHQAQMAEQVAQMRAFYDEELPPAIEDDEDLDNLPLDDGRPKKKKARVKKKVKKK